MIRHLVSFDTTSRESNLALIDWIGTYLRGFGIDSRLTFDDTGKKANLFATIGPRIDGGIVLQVTPTWFRWMARNGIPIRGRPSRPATAWWDAASAT
jgi:hypothetical protein